jgi:Domain of unknown function (DUF4234)
MRNRSIVAIIVFTILTLGIYGIYWFVSTKGEMKALGADIPTSWLIIVPIANIWWLWKYSQGVQKVTKGNLDGILAFVLVWLVSIVGMAIVQNEFNKVGGTSTPKVAPAAA